MPSNLDPLTTSVLLIEGFVADCICFADQLKRCSFNSQILEVTQHKKVGQRECEETARDMVFS